MSNNSRKKNLPIENGETHAYRSRTNPPRSFVIASLTDTWNGPGEVFEEDGIVYERTDHVKIDVDQIPDHVRYDLLETIMEATKEYFKQPGVEEKFQAWLKERNRAQQGEVKEKGQTEV